MQRESKRRHTLKKKEKNINNVVIIDLKQTKAGDFLNIKIGVHRRD